MDFQRKLNLTLHCGSNLVDWDTVKAAVTPEATDSWCPIPHHEFVGSVLDTLGGAGLKVAESCHALWKDGNRYFGSFQLVNGEQHDDYALVVGLRNSHDKSFPAGLACGSGVFVCDNLSFSGEVRLSRRHTAHIREDLPRLINLAVGRLGTMKVNQETRLVAYKQREVNDIQAHDLLVRAVDCKALPITRLPAVLENWRNPPHAEFQDRTAWSLFNAFTEIYKESGVQNISARSIPLHGLVDQFCGLKVMEPEVGPDAEIQGGTPQLALAT